MEVLVGAIRRFAIKLPMPEKNMKIVLLNGHTKRAPLLLYLYNYFAIESVRTAMPMMSKWYTLETQPEGRFNI